MNEIEVKQKTQSIRILLDKSKEQIAKALPKHLSADRIMRVAMTSIQRTPKLLEASPVSLIGAIIQSAQLGLEPDGVLGHAYLIPFKNNKKGGIYEVQFMPGYKGLIDLARRSGQISRISAHIVYEGEHFELKYGLTESIEHTPCPPSQRGERIGAYAMALLKDGSCQFEFLWEEELQRIQQSSRSQNIWAEYPDEMRKKTAIRRLVKYLPLSVELAKAAVIDELGEAGVDTSEDFGLVDVTPAKKAKSIDEALNNIEKAEPVEAEAVEVKTEPVEEQKPLTFADVEAKANKMGVTMIIPYVVRSIGSNKPKEVWSGEECAKIIAEIEKVKKGK